MNHAILLQNDKTTPLGRLRLAGEIHGGRGVEPAGVFRVYGSYGVMCVISGTGGYRDIDTRVPTPLTAGDAVLVFPERAHWYGPTRRAQTWDELYVTFDGPAFDLWRQAGLLNAARPVIRAPEGWASALRFLVSAPSSSPSARLRQTSAFIAHLTTLLVSDDAGKPDENSTDADSADSLPAWAVRARGMLEVELGRPLDPASVAADVGLSYENFRKQFQRAFGISPARYRTQRRIEAARELLRYSPQMTNRQAAATLGFADEYHFSRRFTQIAGITPRAFRQLRPASEGDEAGIAEIDAMSSTEAERSSSFAVRPLTPSDKPALHDLRLRILRPGMQPEAAVFDGDDSPTTVHLGAFDQGGRLVGIGTLVENNGFQLRGMATEPDVRGKGAGAAVLRAAHEAAAERGQPLWCNARVTAVGFYQRHGWYTVGDEFDIPTVGPHFVMRGPVPPPPLASVDE